MFSVKITREYVPPGVFATLFRNDTDEPIEIDAAFWRERAREAQERIHAGSPRLGDGILAFANCAEDYDGA